MAYFKLLQWFTFVIVLDGFCFCKVEMALPSYYISTSVTCVDTTTTSKVLMLPPANTIPNVNLYIYDSGGAAATNPIYVSTQQGDEMDNAQSLITLNVNNQSFRITPYNATKYAICQNYTQGLTPFENCVRLLITWAQVAGLSFYDYNTGTVSDSGEKLFVTATGGTLSSNGIYYSGDLGANFTNVQAINTCNYAGDSSSSSSDGTITYVSINNPGTIYRGTNGTSWEVFDTLNYEFLGISSSSDGLNAMTYDIATVLYYDRSLGNFSVIREPELNSFYRSGCMSGDTSTIYMGLQTPDPNGANLLIGTKDRRGDWTFVDGGGPSPVIWAQLVCNENGTIAYGRVVTFLGDTVYRTKDGGVQWSELTALANVSYISCDSTGNLVLAIAGGLSSLYVSGDSGDTFQEVSPQLANLTSVTLSRNGRFFIATTTTSSSGTAYRGEIRLA